MNAKSFKRLINIYPPYLGAGVRVRSVSPDFRHIRVEMALRWYNRMLMRKWWRGWKRHSTCAARISPGPIIPRPPSRAAKPPGCRE
jgi:hypothetical protein